MREVDTTRSMDLLLRAARGHVDDEVTRWLSGAICTWLRAAGAIDWHRALRIPRNPQRFVRDHYLCVAAGALQMSDAPPHLARAIAMEWFRFVSRGPWVAWRDAGGPPENASVLRSALYHATVASGGHVLGQRQLNTIISRGNISLSQFPDNRATLLAVHDERDTV